MNIRCIMSGKKRIAFWVELDEFLRMSAIRDLLGYPQWKDFFKDAVEALARERGVKISITIEK